MIDQKDNEVVYLHLDDIIPNRFQPRQVFDEKALKELAVSIKEHGVIQPIIVRNIGNKYEIIAGERRYKASALAGLTKIPAIVRNLDDKESSKVALLENLQRKNLNPIEEAKTYQKILELDQMTQEELAKTMGKSQSAVANKLRLLSLTDEVQDALLKDEISERHARTLLSVEPEEQKKLLKEVIANKMTVRELEDKIKPKEEKISVNEVENLLNTPKVSTTPLTQPTNDFNQNVGIDYSTPPKFIDYDTPSTTDNLESTATKPIDINELKDNAQDINVQTEKPDMDNFLSVDNHETSSLSQEPTFKFFDTTLTPTGKPTQEATKVSPASDTTIKSSDPFSVATETPNINDATSTSMDTLLAGMNQQEDKTPPIAPVDPYNNPFARNPIFRQEVTEQNNQDQAAPKMTINESISILRDTVKKLEASGIKIDTDEMDLVNNYQIVIKIAKDPKE